MNKALNIICKTIKGCCMLSLLIFLILLSTKIVWAGVKNSSPYLIKVNRVHNTITIYEKDQSGKYSQPIKAMTCSVGLKGTQTVLGTYNTKEKYRWKALMGNVWGQYSTRIVGGILFHSVYYYRNGNPATLAAKEFNKLGTAASHGCIRLTVEDAKWIYDNCPIGTTVIIYDGKESPGPLGKPEVIKIPVSAKWDPTDPDDKNPFKNRKPSINGTKNQIIPWGTDIDLVKGVTAKCSMGFNITEKIVVKGKVKNKEAGKYNVTYSVTDALGRTRNKKITVTVEERPCNPVFMGISDRVVRGDRKITRSYALKGVQVYCLDKVIMFNNKEVKVFIDKVNNEMYDIIYQIQIGNSDVVTEYASFYVDASPPVFMGVSDRIMEQGQKLDETYALTGVSVYDNYSDLDHSNIIITIVDNYDGSYFVTYEVQDEVGNTSKETVRFQYREMENDEVA